MNHYFIKLKSGKSQNLINAMVRNLKLDKELALKLVMQGSVWDADKNIRIKDSNFLIKNELIKVIKPDYPVNEYFLKKEFIIYEDPHFLIVYKESGVPTQGTQYSDITDLTYGIQKYFDEKNIQFKASCVNRLDMGTEGLVFFAKTKEAGSKLHIMFHDRKIKKAYYAATAKFDIQIKSMIIRDSLEWLGKKQDAETMIRFIKEMNGLYYFLVLPHTGRTHQIRKHFKAYLHPISGDALYGGYSRNDKMMLNCFYYRFIHPYTFKKMKVSYMEDRYKFLSAGSRCFKELL
jgi:23S rRNA pseudouridine1911/1915/1917 synthase